MQLSNNYTVATTPIIVVINLELFLKGLHVTWEIQNNGIFFLHFREFFKSGTQKSSTPFTSMRVFLAVDIITIAGLVC